MKNVQRINESKLRAIVAESVKKVLNERTDADSDGQWDYQWLDKKRENKAKARGLRKGMMPADKYGYSWRRNPNDIERRRKAGEYDGNERHNDTYYQAVGHGIMEIENNGVFACARKYGTDITFSALQEIVDTWTSRAVYLINKKC